MQPRPALSREGGDSERQAALLRGELDAALARCGALEQRLVSHPVVEAGDLQEAAVERVVVAADMGRLLRGPLEPLLASAEERHRVAATVEGQAITLRGARLSVRLLKAEIQEVLLAAMAAPSPESSRSLALVGQTEGTAVRALQQALSDSQAAAAEARADRDRAVVAQRTAEEHRGVAEATARLQVAELQRRLAVTSGEREEALAAAQQGLQALDAEAAVCDALRREREELRDAVVEARAAARAAEVLQAAAETRCTAAEEQGRRISGEAVATARREEHASMLGAQLEAAAAELAALRARRDEERSDAAAEVATLRQRCTAAEDVAEASRRDLAASEAAQSRLARELSAAHRALLERRTQGDPAPEEPRPAGPDRAVALENERLRRELHGALRDMRLLAEAIEDGRAARERLAVSAADLEVRCDEARAAKRHAELAKVQAEMAARSREATMALELSQAQEEVRHQTDRAEALHREYQAKLASLLVPAAAAEDDPEPGPPPPQPQRQDSSARVSSPVTTPLWRLANP